MAMSNRENSFLQEKIVIQNQISKKSVLILLLSGCLLFANTLSGYAATQEFTGLFTEKDDKGSGMYARIPVSIDSDSEVSLNFGAGCEYQGNLSFRFNTATNPKEDSFIVTGGDETVQPMGYYALKKGDYVAEIFCRSEMLNSYTEVEFNVTVVNTPISIGYSAEDTEPDPDYERNITKTTDFSGWLGFVAGYPATTINPKGGDWADLYMLNMAQGTKVEFKLDFDEFKSSNGGRDIAFKFRIYRWKDNKTYFVDEFDPITESGQTTKQITLNESGAYKFYVSSSHSSSEAPTDNGKYGGYKVTVIINGEPVPEPEPEPEGLFLNILSAEWKSSSLGSGLVMKYQVKNTYNEAKTIQPVGILLAPMPWDASLVGSAPDLTNSDYLQYIYHRLDSDSNVDFFKADSSNCQQDETKLTYSNIYPNGCGPWSECQVMQITMKDNSYTISPHTTEEYLAFVVPTAKDYRRLAEGYQTYSIMLDFNGDSIPDACHAGGLYYWPKRAIAGWILNLLLKSNAK